MVLKSIEVKEFEMVLECIVLDKGSNGLEKYRQVSIGGFAVFYKL